MANEALVRTVLGCQINDQSEGVAVAYFAYMTMNIWDKLPHDLHAEIIRSIQEYVVYGIDPFIGTNEARKLWELSIKPTIDNERSNGR